MTFLKALQPALFGGLQLRNRLIVPPMVTYLGGRDGKMTDELIEYARTRARGGFGLFTLEATYVDRSGCGFRSGVGIDEDNKIPGLQKLTQAIHAEGGKISIQLHHAGRETSAAITGTTLMAPSECPVNYSSEAVREMTKDDIAFIIRRFAEAAERAVRAGFDAIMLHGAHGYLLSQFLSPYTNKRRDDYGGSLENRLRLPLEIIQAVRSAAGPNFPISYRMSVEEHSPGGLSLQEACRAAALLSRSGINDIHVVAGNYDTNELVIAPACYGNMVNRARLRAIRQAVGADFPLTVAGRITGIFEAESLIQEGLADFIAMGRASIADPELPLRCAKGEWNSVRVCLGCNDACIGRTSKELGVGCAINPYAGREFEFAALQKANTVKKILVIGAGPAGMEAAWAAARLGHSVVLAEKENHVGGQFWLAAFPPLKDGIFPYLGSMVSRLAQEGVSLRLNTAADEALIREIAPAHIILATGGSPITIPFAGLDTVFTTTAQQVLNHHLDKLGRRVAVIGGGMVGCETAEFIAQTGRHVDIIEMQSSIIPDLFTTVRSALLTRLNDLGVAIHTESKVIRIENSCVVVNGTREQEHAIGPIDTVVMALGVRPNTKLEETCIKLNIPYTKIGDCLKQGNCRHATQSALAVYTLPD